MDIEILLLLFGLAVFAGTIDAIAGGGGLITVPALLLSGITPLQVLATNKTQATFGTGMAVFVMVRKQLVTLPSMYMSIIYVAISAALGVVIVQWIDQSALEFLIPLILFVMTFYVIFSPKPSEVERTPRMKPASFRWVSAAIGLYDGVLGPGAGSMFTLSHVGLRGTPIIEATARAKVLNLTSNIASLIVFLVSGHIVWMIAVVMIAGQVYRRLYRG